MHKVKFTQQPYTKERDRCHAPDNYIKPAIHSTQALTVEARRVNVLSELTL